MEVEFKVSWSGVTRMVSLSAEDVTIEGDIAGRATNNIKKACFEVVGNRTGLGYPCSLLICSFCVQYWQREPGVTGHLLVQHLWEADI